ncbi:MAG: choice-of-anchor L domain-containing protein [Bacteroidales bacterium]|nr:choice-of-anchor L domain-containing protein [Bacteroidales bacterium]
MAMTPEQLVTNWLLGVGVSVSNVTFNGSSSLITSPQIGTFQAAGNALSQLGIAEGILMTSGQASLAIGPNSGSGVGASQNGPGDPDLTALAGTSTHDKCIIEFDFVPESDTIEFRYVFGSDEFYDYCESINDAFGFFLSGPGISGPYSNSSINIALMPGSNNSVTINNMCLDPTSNWCNDNNPNPGMGNNNVQYQSCNEVPGTYFQYDGLSYVFTATHVVIPCSTYHIKLAIADAVDWVFDSGVFLEKNSFTSVGIALSTSFSLPALGNRAIEGCSNATVNVVSPEPVALPYTVYFTIGGTAINGVDYTEIPDSVIIPAGGTTASLVIQPLYDGIPEGVETVILEFAQPGCSNNGTLTDTILISDNTPFFVNAGADDTICAGDSATLSGVAWGGQRPYDYTWQGFTAHDSIVKVSPPPGSYEYYLHVEEGCGVTESDTMSLLVKPLPELTVGAHSDTICSGETIIIPLSASLPGSSILWTSSNLSGNVTGHAPGSGSSISQTLFNNSFVLDSLRYTIGASTDGCSGPDTSLWIYIRPIPNLIFTPPTMEVCNGQTTAISISSGVTGTTYSWTATSSNPNIAGYSDGTGSSIMQTLNTSDQNSDTVFYHVTASANSCTSDVTDFPVVVNPVPSVTVQPMWDTICSYATTNIQLSASCFGTSYTWTAAQGTGNVSGFSDGSGSVIDQQLVNPLPTTGSVEYSITPSTSSCTGQDTVFTMWVKPTPQVTNSPPGDSVCNNTTVNIVLTSDVTGATFIWTCTPSSTNITGWSEQPLPSLVIDQTLLNSGYDIETVTYHITPDISGCSGNVADYIVTVYPTPDLSNSPSIHAQCNGLIVGGQPSGLSLESNVTNTTFTWRSFSSSPATFGFHDQTVTGSQFITDTLVNIGFEIDTVTYRILPTTNGCQGDSTDYRVVVYPTPDLSNTPLMQSECNGQPTGLTLQSNVPGTLFTWTAIGSSSFVSGFFNSAVPGTQIDQTLVNTGYDVETVTYRIVPGANGCNGDTTDYTVTVFPVADVLFVPNGDTLCSGEVTNLTLQSNVPGTSFVWTATGSSPNVTGYANGSGNLIQQTLTNAGYMPEWASWQIAPTANGCSGTQNSVVVTVNPLPVVSLTPCFDTITTTNAQPIWLNGGIPLAGNYSGLTVNGREFFPALAGSGSHEIKYTYINEFNCIDSASLSIHITDPGSHICGDTLQDVRDSLKYPTVSIGSQCWMAANLNYGQQIVTSSPMRDNCISEKYCYNDNPALCALGAVLYQWSEVMRYRIQEGVQGLCPPGWHLPTESDWDALFNNYISNGFAANPLKYSGYSGFNALLNGIRFHNLEWRFPATDITLNSTIFWSGTLHGPDKAWAHGFNDVVADKEYTPSVSLYPAMRSNAFSVRCIND